jgi:APA family basic amino acid/polyamine antiporter
MTTNLHRVIGRRDVALLVIGSVIGSGIFLVPGVVLRQSGGAVGVALVAWLLGGLLSFLGALTYAELGAMNPGSGGLYLYIRDAFGRLPAFLYGWILLLVICSGTVATLAVASATYLRQLLPYGPGGTKVVSILMIVGLTWLNVRGTRLSVVAMNGATLLKVAALVALIVVLPLAGPGLGTVEAWWPNTMTGGVLQGIGLAMISVLWAYEGWQYANFVAGEVVDPQRNLAPGLAMGTLAIIAIYVLANLAYVAALGPEGVAQSDRVAAEALQVTLGPAAAGAITIPIIISMLSAAHSSLLTLPRAFFAMSRDGLFLRSFGEVHPRYGTPAIAIIAGGAGSAVLAMLGTFEQLLNYVVFVGWIFYGLGGASLFVFRRRLPDAPRPFRIPGYPLTPALFVLSAAAFVLNSVFSQPIGQTVAGLGIVAAGLPAYWWWAHRSRKAPQP